MRYQLKKILFSVLAASTLVFVPLSAAAQAPNAGLNDLQTASGNSIPQPINVQGREGVVAVIAEVVNWALYLSGAIAVIFVIIGGYRYLTAGGNEETAVKGRKTVVNALVGLVIIILAYVIVNAVTNFLSP